MSFQYWDTQTGLRLNTTDLRERYNARRDNPQALNYRIGLYEFIDGLLRDGSITDKDPAEPDTDTCDCDGCMGRTDRLT